VHSGPLMVPEAEQLLEPIDAYCRVATRDLLFVERASTDLRPIPFSVFELTHGIPTLVSALKPGCGDSLVGGDGFVSLPRTTMCWLG